MVHAGSPVCNKTRPRTQTDDVCLVRCLNHPAKPPVPARWGSRPFTGPDGQRVRYPNCGRPFCPVHGHLFRRRQADIWKARLSLPPGHTATSFVVHLKHAHGQRALGDVYRAIRNEAQTRWKGSLVLSVTEWQTPAELPFPSKYALPHLHVLVSHPADVVVTDQDIRLLAAEARVALEGRPVPAVQADPVAFRTVDVSGHRPTTRPVT